MILLILTICFAVNSNLFADDTESGMQFLKIGADAKGVALSGANISDVQNSYWNPAGLNNIKSLEILGTYSQYLKDMNYLYLWVGKSFLQKIGANLGFSLIYLNQGELSYSGIEENINEKSHVYNLGLNLTYAFYIENIGIGMNLKYLNENIADDIWNLLGIDLGVQGNISKKAGLKFGVIIKNIIFQNSNLKNTMPKSYQLGLSYLREIIAVFMSICFNNDDGINLNSGIEYKIFESINLRCGYKFLHNVRRVDSLKGWSFGFGIGNETDFINIDFAYIPMGILGNSLQTSLILKF